MAEIGREPAGLYPDKVALNDGRQSYTFAEVERLSTGFAAYLASRGVQRGDRVAFPSPKSATLIVAIIGCLKAGAAYVPVDSKLPPNRLAFILDDVAPRFVVASQARYDAVAPELATARDLIDEDRLPEYFAFGGEGVTLPDIDPGDVAYIIYTSGSTGRPKGVQIQHASVDAFYHAFVEVMPIDASSRC
jgi:non-ribosomal peptide synthetase component F